MDCEKLLVAMQPMLAALPSVFVSKDIEDSRSPRPINLRTEGAGDWE